MQLSKDFADDLAGRVDVEDPKVTVGVEAFQQQGAAARVGCDEPDRPATGPVP